MSKIIVHETGTLKKNRLNKRGLPFTAPQFCDHTCVTMGCNNGKHPTRIFSACAPTNLVGAFYLQPPDAGASFLFSDLTCNYTCSVTGRA